MSSTWRMAVLTAGTLALVACGGDVRGEVAPVTVADTSRPLSEGRQRRDSFLERSGGADDQAAESADESSDGEPSDEDSGDEDSGDEGGETSDDDASATNDSDSGDTESGDTESGDEDPFAETKKAFARFASGSNAATAVSLTVVQDSVAVFRRAVGESQDEREATPDSPMAIGEVSKLVTVLAIGRLEQEGLVDTSAPVPWAAMGIDTHSKWEAVTVRELIDQTAGMPAKNNLWKTSTDDCATNAAVVLKGRPAAKRTGIRTNANGNGCVLGLLIEHLTGESLEAAVQRLVFEPVDADGFHTTEDGLQDGDAGVLDDLLLTSTGGAGTYVVSSDDLTAVFASLDADDLSVFDGSAVMNDQYGWGHTGIANDMSSCLWVLDDGDIVIAATAVGDTVKGGVVCDRFVPAIATDLDLGLGSAKPDRNK